MTTVIASVLRDTPPPDRSAWEQREEARIKRLQRQMRDQDERRFQDPTHDPTLPLVFVLYTWRDATWIIVGFRHNVRPTPKRVNKWRRKAKVLKGEVLRVLDLWTAQRYGPGAPPLAPPTSQRPARLRQQNHRVQEAVRGSRAPRTDPRLSTCDRVEHRLVKKQATIVRCEVRAPWSVGYTVGGRRVVRHRCRKHAWDDAAFPPTAKHLVRVQREVDHA